VGLAGSQNANELRNVEIFLKRSVGHPNILLDDTVGYDRYRKESLLMRTRSPLATALLTVVLLAGCSQQSTPAPSEAPSTSALETSIATEPPEPSVEAIPSTSETALSDLAERMSCTGYALAATVAPGAAEYGTCQLEDVRIQLYRFATQEDKQVFLEQVKVYGVVESQLALTDDGLIAAALADQRLLPQLKTALAGRLTRQLRRPG
jgi:hypothetical protein